MAGEYPDVIPMLSYEDGVAALEWLARAFGFRERARMVGPDGRLSHAEMETGEAPGVPGGVPRGVPRGVIMLATPTPDYESQKRHREHCERARAWSAVPWVIDGVLVYVDDVDGHCERARRNGAVILSEPEPGPPGRRYRVEDLEGHRWMFMQRT